MRVLEIRLAADDLAAALYVLDRIKEAPAQKLIDVEAAAVKAMTAEQLALYSSPARDPDP